jgi:cephalosporin-C deacetylase-like acetyl esterase
LTHEPHGTGQPRQAGGGLRAFAHVGDPTPAAEHSGFWAHWFRVTASSRPVLTRRTEPDESDPTATHEYVSLGGVRIGCRLVLPPEEIRGAVVVVHGTEDVPMLEAEDRRARAAAACGLAVLVVRLRGFPGSRVGIGFERWSDARAGWFVSGLDAPERTPEGHLSWVIPGAVADVVNACRAVRNVLLGRTEGLGVRVRAPATPAVALKGVSLGAGLCVIAAAQLTGKLPQERVVERLVLATPGLGDWPWRLAHAPGTGSAAAVGELLSARPELTPAVHERLRLCDALVHAPRVRCPVLCKLAVSDGVVPPEAAAGVYNALAADPGQKWRFLVEHGHGRFADPGARRHALFERAAAEFLDPGQTPERAMEPWEGVLSQIGAVQPPSGAGGEQGALFAHAPAAGGAGTAPGDGGAGAAVGAVVGAAVGVASGDAALIAAYAAQGVTLDALPYTPAFAWIVARVGIGEREALHRLHTLRKAGRLPRLGRAPERPGRLDPAHEAVLAALVIREAGAMGQRDRLPHTPAFERVVEEFNAKTGLAMSAHDVWRQVARMAK